MKETETEMNRLTEALHHIYHSAAILGHLNHFTVYQIKISHFDSSLLVF